MHAAQARSASTETTFRSVFAILGLSACVSSGVAYVVLDYTLSPFARLGGDAVAQSDVAQPPILAATLSDARLPDITAAPAFTEAPNLQTARADTSVAFPRPVPVRLVTGPPPVRSLPRPGAIESETIVAEAALRPSPRPDRAPRDLTNAVGLAVAAALEPVDPAPPTFTGARLSASLVPDMRPASLAATLIRQPNENEEPAGIQVARANAPDADIAPAALRPAPELFDAPRAGNPCHGRLARDIPRRPRNAPGGSGLVSSLTNSGGADRDARVVQAALSGNVPDFLRNLRPVSFAGEDSGGRDVVVTICVTPDYLALGSDRDFVRVPLGLPAALRVADGFDMMLPTTRMVDAIYAQADLHLRPQPMTPGAQMSSTNYFMRHDAMVDEQYARAGGRLGALVAGHKKDVVLANRLSSNPGRVAIYGWHRARYSPIQPLSTVHGAQYADYSHGIRLVSRTAFVNGDAVDLGSLLTNPRYATLLNSDGVIAGRAVQMASLR